MDVATEFSGNDSVSPYACQQISSDPVSADEYIQMLDLLFGPQSVDQWQIASNELLSQSLTDFNFGVLEEEKYVHHNGPQNTTPNTGTSSSIVATSDNLLREKEALPNAFGLQRQSSDSVPFVNQNREHIHLQERLISPLLLSGTYPPFPSPYQSEIAPEQLARTITTMPRLQEKVLPFTSEVPRDSVGIDLSGSHNTSILNPCNRALQSCWDRSSTSTSFLSNYGSFQLAEIHDTMAQHLRTPGSPAPVTVNPAHLFTSTGRGGTPTNDGESFRAYIPSLPLQPRSRPRGRPNIRTWVVPPVPCQGQSFKIRCDWEGKCSTYVHVDQAGFCRHIRSHVANEMLKAMSGVAVSSSNVRYDMSNPSHSGLGSQFQLQEMEPEVRVRMLMEGGRVWARCLWGANGCCCSRGEVTLEYLPRHVCYMHLGLPRC